jgi:hypothetical protein
LELIIKKIFFLLLILTCSCVPVEQVDKITASLLVSDDKVNFGNTFLQEAVNRKVTLTHAGSLPLTKLSINSFNEEGPFDFSGGEYPGTSGTCGSSLSNGESCEINLTFIPNSSKVWKEELVISYFNGVNEISQIIPLVGIGGTSANLEAQSGNFNLGLKEILSKTSQEIIITNTGDLHAEDMSASFFNGSNSFLFKGEAYPGAGGTCGDRLNGKASCKIVLEYAPINAGIHSDSLKFNFKNPDVDGSLTIPITARAANIQAIIEFKPPEGVSFPDTTVGFGNSKILKIENIGFLPGEQINFTFSNSASFEVVSHTCLNNSLAVSSTCNVEIRFIPATVGNISSSLTVNYHNGKILTSRSINLTGIGLSQAQLVFNLAPFYDFGVKPVNTEFSKQVKLTNNGNTEATNLQIAALASPFQITSTTCKTKLPPTGSCFISFMTNPTDEIEVVRNLDVNFFNGAQNTTSSLGIKVTGKKIAILSFGENTETQFPRLMVGEGDQKILTVTNIGTKQAQNITSSLLTGAITFLGDVYPGTGGTCGLTLGPGESCSLFISTTSLTNGAYNQFLTLSYFNGDEVILTGTHTISAVYFSLANLLFFPSNPDNLSDANYKFAISAPNTVFYNNVRLTAEQDGYSANIRIISVTMDNPSFTPVDATEMPWTNATDFEDCAGQILDSYDGSLGDNSCWATYAFSGNQLGDQVGVITVKYYNDIYEQNEQTKTFQVTGQVDDIGFGNIPVSIDFGDVAKGGSLTKVLTVTNSGSATMANITLGSISNSKFSVVSNNCANLIAGESCDISIKFAPPLTVSYDKLIQISYDNGLYHRTHYIYLFGTGKLPANLKLLTSSKDFGPTLVDSTKSFTFTLSNSGAVTAQNLSFENLQSPYEFVDINCGSSLAAMSTCEFRIDYTPTSPGQLDNKNFLISYKNGMDLDNLKTLTATLSGTGELPPSTHMGWEEIYAVGDKKSDLTNSSVGDRVVRIRWNEMIPADGFSISGYQIFRSTTSGVYDFNTPIGSTANNIFNFEDKSTSPGVTYYYIVKPVVFGTLTRTLANFSEVKIVSPPYNMVFVHRWMANKILCESLGASVEKASNYRCSLTGPGTLGGKFDLGYNLLVDRFELGADGTSRSNQVPYANTQSSSWSQCQNTLNSVFLDGSPTPILKRLLSRKEYLIVSKWPSNMSNSEINDLEQAFGGSGKCNGSGSSMGLTGSNPECKSMFGAEDMAGNSWEWVSDRVFNGFGVSEALQKLDPLNSDMDGINQTTEVSGQFELKTCYNPIIGLPLAKVDDQCPTGSLNIGTSSLLTPSAQEFFQNDYFYQAGAGLRMGAAGGSHLQASGRYTFGWLSTVSLGARCAAVIP